MRCFLGRLCGPDGLGISVRPARLAGSPGEAAVVALASTQGWEMQAMSELALGALSNRIAQEQLQAANRCPPVKHSQFGD